MDIKIYPLREEEDDGNAAAYIYIRSRLRRREARGSSS